MPFVDQHSDARPGVCEVCRYLQLRPELDRMREHTLSMFASWILLEDLENSDVPLQMISIYVEHYPPGPIPGQSQALDPRHWMLALLTATEVRLTMDRTEDAPDD